MFDIGWSELLILAVVTLIVVGPKDLPVLMRTLGRYAGVLRRHADEFRGHFDAAMQEAEIDQMQADLESVTKGLDQSLDDAKSAVEETAEDVDLGEPSDTDRQEIAEPERETLSIDSSKGDA